MARRGATTVHGKNERMKILAQATLDYIIFLTTTDHEDLDPRLARQTLKTLMSHLRDAPEAERKALSKAARATLAAAAGPGDEDDFTAHPLVSGPEQRILAAIGDGSFFEEEDEEDEDEDDF